MKIKKGDKVKIIAGKDRGRDGVVVRALPKMDQVVIDGMNMHKKHV
ncbi:MAG: KOW motif-containing protein, partial [Patescibacteria group bacterium]